MTPRRHQMRRTRGWRKPEGAVYVGRPSAWGNPFVDRDVGGVVLAPWYMQMLDAPACFAPRPICGRGNCVDVFRLFIDGKLPEIRGVTPLTDRALDMRRHLSELTGRDVICWCGLDCPCHGDVLIELANPRRADDETRPAPRL